jgi:thioredoxin-like negative regulator of GroEL
MVFMLTVLLTMLLTGVTGNSHMNSSRNYASAYRAAQDRNLPLVVVVGAEWCPACVNLKRTTIASMEASGELQEVSLAVIDQDSEPELARMIKKGEMIPQIVVFSKTDQGWRRTQLTGFQAIEPLRSLIRTAKTESDRS